MANTNLFNFFVPFSFENFFDLFLSYPSFKQACAVGTKACHVIQYLAHGVFNL